MYGATSAGPGLSASRSALSAATSARSSATSERSQAQKRTNNRRRYRMVASFLVLENSACVACSVSSTDRTGTSPNLTCCCYAHYHFIGQSLAKKLARVNNFPSNPKNLSFVISVASSFFFLFMRKV